MWHAILYSLDGEKAVIQYTNGTTSIFENLAINSIIDLTKLELVAILQDKVNELNALDTKKAAFLNQLTQYVGKQIV